MSDWADYAESTALPHIAWCLQEHGYHVVEDDQDPDRLVVRDEEEQVATVERVGR